MEDFIAFIFLLVLVAAINIIKLVVTKARQSQPGKRPQQAQRPQGLQRPPPPPDQPAAPAPPRQIDAGEQIRQFVEQVTGVPQEPPRPKPKRRRKPKPAPEPKPEPVVAAPVVKPRPPRRKQFDMEWLRDRDSLRTAVIMREVLGKPLSLRKGRD